MVTILARLILGNNRQHFSFIRIKGAVYKVDIQPFESADVLVERMGKAL